MPDIQEMRVRTDHVLKELEQLSQKQDRICTTGISSGIGTATYPGLAELEELRIKTETLRQQLQKLKNRSKLDPEVRELETNLDEALSRYYWLWQKCKDNMNGEPH